MLRIHFGKMEEEIHHPPTYFDNMYEDEWITAPLTIDMIKDIDKSEVVSSHLIISPVLGPIPVKEIAGGTKTLILMAFDETGSVFNATSCGDNCAKWIVEIAKRKDLTITLHHLMNFSKVESFEAVILNTGKVAKNYREYLNEAFYIRENMDVF